MHTGTDFSAGDGLVYAADDGVVLFTEYNTAYGNMTVIDHGKIGGLRMTTLYAHQSAVGVKPGDAVIKGQAIGVIGSTGYATGPHLHFEVRINGEPSTRCRSSEQGPVTHRGPVGRRRGRGPADRDLSALARLSRCPRGKERACVRPAPRSCLLSRRSPWQRPLSPVRQAAPRPTSASLSQRAVPSVSVPVPTPTVSVPSVPVPTPSVPSVPLAQRVGARRWRWRRRRQRRSVTAGRAARPSAPAAAPSTAARAATATTRAARKKAAKRQADATPMIAGTKAAENLVDDESSPELYRASQSFLTADQGIAEIARQKQVMARLKQDATKVAQLYRAMGYDVAGAERVATAWHQRYDGLAADAKTGERRMVGDSATRADERLGDLVVGRAMVKGSSSRWRPGTPRPRRRWPTPAPRSPPSPRSDRPL